jgi:hypothetical protein
LARLPPNNFAIATALSRGISTMSWSSAHSNPPISCSKSSTSTRLNPHYGVIETIYELNIQKFT